VPGRRGRVRFADPEAERPEHRRGLDRDAGAVTDSARATGSDVPVCLDPTARMMRGAGETVGPRIALPGLPAVLREAVRPGEQAQGRRRIRRTAADAGRHRQPLDQGDRSASTRPPG
jgi:hypothetical protein